MLVALWSDIELGAACVSYVSATYRNESSFSGIYKLEACHERKQQVNCVNKGVSLSYTALMDDEVLARETLHAMVEFFSRTSYLLSICLRLCHKCNSPHPRGVQVLRKAGPQTWVYICQSKLLDNTCWCPLGLQPRRQLRWGCPIGTKHATKSWTYYDCGFANSFAVGSSRKCGYEYVWPAHWFW